MEIAPGLFCPPLDQNYEFYETYIEEHFPVEGPSLFGLHSNAEIGFLLAKSDAVFSTIIEIEGVEGEGLEGMSDIETGTAQVQQFLARLPPQIDLISLEQRAVERTPYVSV